MLPTTAATATPINRIQDNHNTQTICEYLMECVTSIINCVREFFATICYCTRETRADQKTLPVYMSFDQMIAENPQLTSWLSSPGNNLKLEINYQTSLGNIKREFLDVDTLQCQCYCEMLFLNAGAYIRNPELNFKYNIQITITRPAQNEREKGNSVNFNWNNDTNFSPSQETIVLGAAEIASNSNFDEVLFCRSQLRDWFRDGGVDLKVKLHSSLEIPKFQKPLVTERLALNEANCRDMCNRQIEAIKNITGYYSLQFTFSKSNSPNDSLIYTYQNIHRFL